ncbi:hypothetical protein GQ42DRAFT_159433 [Ramicandelaber brevisporus]|nr:hypothetical protein GQ42DRAFT_159433 [Ramicandelaber brevisporus]
MDRPVSSDVTVGGLLSRFIEIVNENRRLKDDVLVVERLYNETRREFGEVTKQRDKAIEANTVLTAQRDKAIEMNEALMEKIVKLEADLVAATASTTRVKCKATGTSAQQPKKIE